MFKKGPARRPQQSRRRSTPPSDEESTAVDPITTSSVVRPTKKSVLNPLVQGSKRRRDLGDADDARGLEEFEFKADESLIDKADSFATRSSNYDLEAGGEATIQGKKVRLNEDGEIDDGMYRGTNSYLSTIKQGADSKDKKMSAKGPIRATANIRSITIMDYQPDVCKPYKETGFCGYGDSCKFLHDRGDYLAGWQLDKLDPVSNQPVQEEEEEEDVPFACLICRKEFVDPVVTKCGHYFCMKCAVERYIKSPKCYACGAPTSGIFNKAEKIIAKLEAKNKRIREAKGIVDEEEAGDGGIEIGGSASDDEEE